MTPPANIAQKPPEQWAKELRDMLYTYMRKNDFPTVQKAKALIEQYDREHEEEKA